MPSQPLSHHPGPISRSGGIPPRKPGPRRRASQARGGNGLRSLWRGRWYLIFALLAGIGLSGTYVGWTLRDMPDPGKDLVLTANQVILDRNGQQIEDRNAQGEFHVSLRLADMGTYGPAATLAAEDRDFYKHGAISPSSLGRAVVTDIHSGGYAEGGSTITQQLVKIQLLSPQKSVFRKIQEAVLAEGLELRYSKDQILEMYLNRVYYGNGAYGLGAAAKTYFNQNAADLTAAQAALLAGLIQAPSAYDPIDHPDLAKERQLYVLKGMLSTHALTATQETAAEKEPIDATVHTEYRTSQAPHFANYVMSQAEQLVGSSEVQRGVVIHTTLDLNLQKQAQTSVEYGVKSLASTSVNNGMLLASNPTTGDILAWVGSVDYYNDAIGGQYDLVDQAQSQPGSAFKPFAYEAALKDRKLTVGSIVPDSNSNDFPGYGGPNWPPDWDSPNRLGNITLREALVNSRNMSAVRAASIEGVSNVVNLATQMGITTPLPSDLQVAIGGGTTSVKMLDLVQAYSVFANQGSKVPLRAITEIDDQAGDVLYKAPALSSQQILTPAESYLMTDVLKGYQTQWQFGWKRQMAAKSGTPAGAGGIPNALIVAYNPTIVVGAWVANTSNDASKTGKITAWSTQVGQYTLNKFINGLPASYGGWFQQPQGIVVGKGCPGMPDSGKEIFLTGTDRSPGCAGSPSPSPTPSPSPSASPSPTPGPSARATPPGPSIVPSVASSPLPVPSLGLTTSPSPTPGPSPSPTPQPSVSP